MQFSLATIVSVASLLSTATAIVPLPTKYTNGTGIVWITPDVKTSFVPLGGATYPTTNSTSPSDTTLIKGAFQRFTANLDKQTYVPWKFFPKGSIYEPSGSTNGTKVSSITITQVASTSNSTDGVDESYTLDLSLGGQVKITAATAQGGMHALTTLSQLFYKSSAGGYYTNQAPVSIQDAPRFPWRGLNVDIARNFEPPSNVKRLIDGLAFNKFNRIHIHATDSQSWPLDLPSKPDLARKGAYAPNLIWTAADLDDVQSYAVARGIIPYIEIDSPGHTASIGYSQPDLIAGFNEKPWPTFCNEPPCGQVKLNNPDVLNFFDDVAEDLYPRTKKYSDVFHTGGDELNANIYGLAGSGVGSNDSAKIIPALQEFVDHLHENVRAAGLKPVVWEEMLLNWNLTLDNKDVIVQTWLSQDSIANATSAGFKTLFGEYTTWYLDCGFGDWIDPIQTGQTAIKAPYTDWCQPYKSWREVYSYDPLVNLTDTQAALVIGGEAHIWGELTDPTNFDGKVWPRASAAAEVLWSGPQGTAGVTEAVTRRLADVRERMVGLGFGASVVQMTWCLQNPGGNCAE